MCTSRVGGTVPCWQRIMPCFGSELGSRACWHETNFRDCQSVKAGGLTLDASWWHGVFASEQKRFLDMHTVLSHTLGCTWATALQRTNGKIPHWSAKLPAMSHQAVTGLAHDAVPHSCL